MTMDRSATDTTTDADARQLRVKYANHMRPAQDVIIQPGMTAGDLLQQLNLGTEYRISTGRVGSELQPSEELWPRVADGDLIFVMSIVEMG